MFIVVLLVCSCGGFVRVSVVNCCLSFSTLLMLCCFIFCVVYYDMQRTLPTGLQEKQNVKSKSKTVVLGWEGRAGGTDRKVVVGG